MEWDPKDKVVVVTGGAMGIGYQIANNFLKEGAKTTILLDIAETTGEDATKTLNETYGSDKAVFIRCDVTKDLEAVFNEIISKYTVDVFVNNAGIVDETSVRRTIEINTIAVMEWGMKFWEYMRVDNGGAGGTIINVASVYGYMNDPWLIFYKASKHAVMGFTKSLGHQYNYDRSGVRVFVVCPGLTFTEIVKDINGKVFEYHREDAYKITENLIMQKSETVGQAIVEMYRKAKSGSAWVAENNEPIREVPM